MSDHIIRMLEAKQIHQLSPSELATIRAHIPTCSNCRRAYKAAHTAAALLRARTAQSVSPPPFFQTRVMVALRAQMPAPDPLGLFKIWKKAAVLACSMVVVLLLVFSLMWYQTAKPWSSMANTYGVASLLIDEGDSLSVNDLTDGQILAAVFNGEDTYGPYE